MKTFSIIAAVTHPSMGIGHQGKIPWKLPSDLKFFKSMTVEHAVIMGRKTWDSIPTEHRPLANRLNIIVSTNSIVSDGAKVVSSFDDALELVSDFPGQVFVIGGGQIYRQAIVHQHCQQIYLTRIYNKFPHDVTFPILDRASFEEGKLIVDKKTENGIEFDIVRFDRVITTTSDKKNVEEIQYLKIVKEIIETGHSKGDRTGVGTLSKFGYQMRFSLKDDRFPLLTTKRTFFRGLAEELFWFIRGSTNAKQLSEKGVKIWDGNASKDFLSSIGLEHREEGDLGPVYGFQWRHFGAEYKTMHDDYTGKGIDQLSQVIETIKTKPDDRRIIMSAWNPCALKEMALPPCHLMCQFYVANGELSCQMYQRSCDMGLGVPFNIASYALLTRLIAQVCGLKPGEFIHTLGDAHVYKNHIEVLIQQLQRTPREFPKLKINPDVMDIEKFTMADLELIDYKPYPKIAMPLAV